MLCLPPKLVERDRGQQTPQVALLVGGEFALAGTNEKTAVGRTGRRRPHRSGGPVAVTAGCGPAPTAGRCTARKRRRRRQRLRGDSGRAALGSFRAFAAATVQFFVGKRIFRPAWPAAMPKVHLLRSRASLSASYRIPPGRFDRMTYVVTQPCFGCKYTDCVVVCPMRQFSRGRKDAVHRPDLVHRLRCLRAGVPGRGDLLRGKSAGRVAGIHRTERRDGAPVP